MVRRRRNKLVIWEWSPDGRHKQSAHDGRRKRSIGREAVGAALLLGAIIFLLSRIPDADGFYRRDRLARYMCQLAGTDPGSPQCVAVSIGGWFAIVVTIGITLKIARVALRSLGIGRESS